MTRVIQICGTGSAVGKSVIVTALCRILLEDGYRVCPFKAQNMSLNSFVTCEGGEMGRAQVVQAQACRIEPSVDMNPILIKPTQDTKAQIIVQGKPMGNMSARQYQYKKHKVKMFEKVKASFERLKQEYEIIVIEGAGSMAEINLKRGDIVNTKMAKYASSPIILVGDIDRGGVFASLIGTLELLTKEERRMVKGIIINKFRGDKALLKSGIDFLEKRSRIKVLGVIPYFKNIEIPEEDSVCLDAFKIKRVSGKMLNIDIIQLPHISNFTDFAILEKEPDVKLNYIKRPEDLNEPDVIIIPGTKSTIKDLSWLEECGLANKILSTLSYQPTATLIGICGGYQMLGQDIYDLKKTESTKKRVKGLGLLPIITYFKKEKILSQVKAKELNSGSEISGYEIHHGQSKKLKDCQPLFKLTERLEKRVDGLEGISTKDGRIWGTYIHAVFDNDNFRRDFLNRIRQKKGWSLLPQTTHFNLDKEFDKLADLVRKNINLKLLYKILNDKL